MPEKTVTVTMNCADSPPTFQLGGDIDPTTQAVEIPPNSSVKVKWTLSAINNPVNAPVFAQPAANGCPGIEFVGGVEDPWAAGKPPHLHYKDDGTEVKMTDDNRNDHDTTDHHYYRINVVWNGQTYQKDPEVDEIGGGG